MVRNVEQTSHTVWIDNFSKHMAHQIPTLEKGTWKQMLWTGRAFRRTRVQVDMSLKYDGDTVVPATPTDPFNTFRLTRARNAAPALPTHGRIQANHDG